MMTQEAEAYAKHRNLKLAADDIGINWRTLYCRLKVQGVPIVGDKSRYGSDKDKLSVMAEREFQRLVPDAINLNAKQFQAKVDFEIYGFTVDVKCALPQPVSLGSKSSKWAFSFKKQALVCDFICCFGMSADKNIERVFLVPKEFFIGIQTVSVSISGKTKWNEFQVAPDELESFFREMRG